jgi:hypothetical protein
MQDLLTTVREALAPLAAIADNVDAGLLDEVGQLTPNDAKRAQRALRMLDDAMSMEFHTGGIVTGDGPARLCDESLVPAEAWRPLRGGEASIEIMVEGRVLDTLDIPGGGGRALAGGLAGEGGSMGDCGTFRDRPVRGGDIRVCSRGGCGRASIVGFWVASIARKLDEFDVRCGEHRPPEAGGVVVYSLAHPQEG